MLANLVQPFGQLYLTYKYIYVSEELNHKNILTTLSYVLFKILRDDDDENVKEYFSRLNQAYSRYTQHTHIFTDKQKKQWNRKTTL